LDKPAKITGTADISGRFRYPADYPDKCASVLETAFAHVPLYRAWKRFDPGPSASPDERFDALPVLTKADMRAGFPGALAPDFKDLGEGLRNGEISYTFTSGTTAERVVNIWNQSWWEESEAASWKLNGHLAALAYPQRQAKLASSLNIGVNCEEDLPMGHRILGQTLYLNEKTSVLQWRPRHLERMIGELNAYRPAVLEANPSLLARLAWQIADSGVEVFSPEVIAFTFEFPSALHLAAVGKVFSSALVSSYGTTETGFVLEQCESGQMHQNARFCRIDYKPLKPEYGGPEIGRIFVTTFGNTWNYILRFDAGDLVRLRPGGECACGRGGLIADAVEGRVANVTFDADGGLVTTKALDDGLSAVAALRDYRLEQKSRARYLLEATLSPGAVQRAAADELRGVLERIYGRGGEYDINFTESILPGPAGKFRRMQADFAFDESGLFI